MNIELYINYIRDGGVHAGIYMDDHVTYVRDADPGTSHPIKGRIRVRLKKDAPSTMESIESVVVDGFAKINRLYEGHEEVIDTPIGTFEIVYREGVPADAKEVMNAIDANFSRIVVEGVVKPFPR